MLMAQIFQCYPIDRAYIAPVILPAGIHPEMDLKKDRKKIEKSVKFQ